MWGTSWKKRARRARAQLVHNYLLIVLALCAGVVTWLVFTLTIGGQPSFWSNVLAGFFTNLLTFVILYLAITRPGVSLPGTSNANTNGALVGFYARHDDVHWSAVIARARTVDIVVHYYNRWVREQSEAFTAVFQRGGTVRLIMADPSIPRTLQDVRRYFFPRLTGQQLVERIRETEDRLAEALDASGSQKAAFKVYYYPQPLHYSFVLVDDRHLFLSLYEQDRGPVIRSSVFEIDLRLDGILEEYWHGNLEHFLAQSREPAPQADEEPS